MLCGTRVRVEISHGKTKTKAPFKRSYDDRNGSSRSKYRSRLIIFVFINLYFCKS